MATNQFGQTYQGNDDFRGYLAANNPSLLAYAGNDGGVNQAAIDANNSSVAGGGIANKGGASPNTLVSAQMVSDAYANWNAARKAPVDNSAANAAASAAAAKAAVNAASRSATQQAIDSLGTELNTSYGNIDANYNSLTGKYDQETAANKATYDDSTVTNNENLAKNKQNALLAAAQGRQGLRSTLSAIGALGGDGAVLADRAVQSGANADLGGAADTYATNAKSLDTALGTYEDQDAQRRKDLDTERTNQRTAAEGSVASKRQTLYQKMADLFGDIGDAGSAGDYLGRAGGLNNEIASKTAVAATPYTEQTAAFTPGSLDSYLAGAGDMSVQVAQGDDSGSTSGLNTLLVGGKKKDKTAATPALATA